MGLAHPPASFPVYDLLSYFPGRYTVSVGKTVTYSVEGNYTELRQNLARLARKSRCPYAFRYVLRLFIFAFNSRQL